MLSNNQILQNLSLSLAIHLFLLNKAKYFDISNASTDSNFQNTQTGVQQ